MLLMAWLYIHMHDEPQIYQQGQLTFFVYTNKIVIITPYQAFYLEPAGHYWNRRLKVIATMIQLHEIRNLNELACWCKSIDGRVGINWVATSRKKYIAFA